MGPVPGSVVNTQWFVDGFVSRFRYTVMAPEVVLPCFVPRGSLCPKDTSLHEVASELPEYD
jgi:hypothetical protein